MMRTFLAIKNHQAYDTSGQIYKVIEHDMYQQRASFTWSYHRRKEYTYLDTGFTDRYMIPLKEREVIMDD